MMGKTGRVEALAARLKQVEFQLSVLRYAVADVAPEYWQRRALYEAIDGIRNGLMAELKPIHEEHPTNQYDLNKSWGILSAWDDQSSERQCAERKEDLKKRFKPRRTPNDKE